MEIYVSTDVESDGPIPGPNSMLSFASAAFTADKQLLVVSAKQSVTYRCPDQRLFQRQNSQNRAKRV